MMLSDEQVELWGSLFAKMKPFLAAFPMCYDNSYGWIPKVAGDDLFDTLVYRGGHDPDGDKYPYLATWGYAENDEGKAVRTDERVAIFCDRSLSACPDFLKGFKAPLFVEFADAHARRMEEHHNRVCKELRDRSKSHGSVLCGQNRAVSGVRRGWFARWFGRRRRVLPGTVSPVLGGAGNYDSGAADCCSG